MSGSGDTEGEPVTTLFDSEHMVVLLVVPPQEREEASELMEFVWGVYV